MKIKVRTIRRASAAISLCGSVLVCVALLLYGENILDVALLTLVFFLATYLVAFFLINQYVIYRIKPIYQILLSKNIKTEQLSKEFGVRNDIVDSMESELNRWVEKNTNEITRLKDNERYRKEFLGNVSHEIKTPIFMIQGYILTLLDGGIEDPTINRKYLERSERNIDRLISIVEDLEEISKLEAGILVLDKSRFDIVALTREIIDSMEIDAQRDGITIRLGSESHFSKYVSADKKRIEQVISNLIVNSIKYGKNGGEIVVNFFDVFDKVMIEVSDNGVGIAQEDLPRIFERFFRTEKSRSSSLGGRGLGLSIVKHIIEAHHQTITVRSKIGEGSTFSFTLNKA